MAETFWDSFDCQQQVDEMAEPAPSPVPSAAEMDEWVDHQIDLTRDLIAEGLLTALGDDDEYTGDRYEDLC